MLLVIIKTDIAVCCWVLDIMKTDIAVCCCVLVMKTDIDSCVVGCWSL